MTVHSVLCDHVHLSLPCTHVCISTIVDIGTLHNAHFHTNISILVDVGTLHNIHFHTHFTDMCTHVNIHIQEGNERGSCSTKERAQRG